MNDYLKDLGYILLISVAASLVVLMINGIL